MVGIYTGVSNPLDLIRFVLKSVLRQASEAGPDQNRFQQQYLA